MRLNPRIGVLALQGDYAAHARAFRDLGLDPVEVRRCAALDALDGLVIPGGESTTLLNLMRDEPWFDALERFHAGGGALFGTCAGAILLATEISGPAQSGLGLLDVSIRRNAYGRQIDSFEDEIVLEQENGQTLRAVFIRAPRFERIGSRVEVLARHGDQPVLVRQGRVMAGTFHPELTDDRRLHARFLNLIEKGATDRTAHDPRERRQTCGSI